MSGIKASLQKYFDCILTVWIPNIYPLSLNNHVYYYISFILNHNFKLEYKCDWCQYGEISIIPMYFTLCTFYILKLLFFKKPNIYLTKL